MPLYFAFGSNMHRLRLERRVGPVIDHGWVVLPDYRHAFAKLGRDGSGKGNIEPREGSEVHGVLYWLTDAQLDALGDYEGGYERVEVFPRASGGVVAAVTFRGVEWHPGLCPTEEYLEHYRQGMAEHGLPEAYVREVFALARGASAGEPEVS